MYSNTAITNTTEACALSEADINSPDFVNNIIYTDYLHCKWLPLSFFSSFVVLLETIPVPPATGENTFHFFSYRANEVYMHKIFVSLAPFVHNTHWDRQH